MIPIEITPLPPPDLVLSDVVAAAQVIDGAQLAVSYKVSNLGAGPSDGSVWYDTIWLSKSRQRPEPGRGDVLLATIRHDGALDVGESYERTATVTLPKHISGEYFITPFANAYETIREDTFDNNANPDDPFQLRGNNFKARPLTVLLNPPPDLVVTDIDAPLLGSAGELYSVSWTVTNQGANPTEDAEWYDQVYLASGPDPSAPGYLREHLASVRHQGVLARNASYTASATWTLSPALSGRAIIVETNARFTSAPDAPGEAGRFGYYTWEGIYTTNNVAIETTEIARGTPDLRVTSVITQPPAYSGENVSVTWTVKNVGDAPVWHGTSHWYDAVFLSRDPVFIRDRATPLGSFIHSQSTPLDVDQSYTNTQEVTLPPGTPGEYYLYVFTDVYQKPSEVTTPAGRLDGPVDTGRPTFFYHAHAWEGGTVELENNNQLRGTLPIIYREPDLIVSELIVPTGAVYSGQRINLEWTVTNQGSRSTRVDRWIDGVYLSRDASLSLDDFELGRFFRIPPAPLSPGESYHVGRNETGGLLSVTLPEGIAGDYYVLVFTDDTNGSLWQVMEFQDEGNNITARAMPVTLSNPPDLQVTHISLPDHVTAGQMLDLNWTVTNLGPGKTPDSQFRWNDLVYLSDDAHFDPIQDRYLGTASHFGALAPGASYLVERSFRIPGNLNGLYYVLVATDPTWQTGFGSRGDVFELDLENNNTLASLPLLVDRPPPSDLQVDNVHIPTSAQTGGSMEVAWPVSGARILDRFDLPLGRRYLEPGRHAAESCRAPR
jgi:hypothetical protein